MLWLTGHLCSVKHLCPKFDSTLALTPPFPDPCTHKIMHNIIIATVIILWLGVLILDPASNSVVRVSD